MLFVMPMQKKVRLQRRLQSDRILFMKKIVPLFCFLLLALSAPALANDVRTAQQLLTELGYDPGPVDGNYSGRTEQAIINFYTKKNKKFDGELSTNEIKDLESSLSVSIAARPKLKK